ncbi:MAG: heparinase II/III family protein [Clostridia bacterium]|nr:heparinase II/III family protein [Clostridia bacterium]
MKKLISTVLTVCLTVSMFISLAISAGVSVTSAAYTSELWVIDGISAALVNGERIELDDGVAPYTYMGNSLTAYLPLSAVVLYTGGAYTVSEEVVTLTREDGNVIVMSADSTEWTFNGTAQPNALMLPVVIKNGEAYLSIGAVLSVFNLNSEKSTLQRFMNTDIGLVILSYGSLSSYSQSYSSLKSQTQTLRHLLYEFPTGDEMYADIEAHAGVDTYPKMHATQDTFDSLRAVYQAENAAASSDANLYVRINRYFAMAEKYFIKYFEYDSESGVTDWREGAYESTKHPYYIYDENGNRLIGKSTYTYTDSETGEEITLTCDGNGKGTGYDEGGRLNDSVNLAAVLPYYAMAWQLTGEERFVDAFYMIGTRLGTWQHWGEGHFLNCADTSTSYARGLDWIWHAFDSEPEKRDELAKILYDLGLSKGALSIQFNYQGKPAWNSATCTFGDTTFTSPSSGAGTWGIVNCNNNWQTVCGTGMISAALVLMSYDEYADTCKSVMSECLANTYKCLHQYAPDGSFIESPGYWGYATRTLFNTLGILNSAAGTDYGYLDAVGLHGSFYFATYICDSTYRAWDYHDGPWSSIRTGSGFISIAAVLYNDANIANFREIMYENCSFDTTEFDLLYYSAELAKDADEELSLDYYGKAIETVTMRSGWEIGSTFTGLHTGANNVSHGDIDSGSFYLDMGGILWIGDEGSENYNVGSYFSNSKRYYYYKKSAEAHNTIVMRDSPNYKTDFKYGGQVFNSQSQTYATITTFKSYGDDGAVAIANMKPQYGSNCTSGRRGIMMTNSRSTVVLQDQISFDSEVSLSWIVNCQRRPDISKDGKTASATLYQGGTKYELRMTLLSDNEELVFEKTGNTTVLPTTVTKENSGNEKASSPDNRLIINADNVTEFNVAVVFELIKHEDEVVGYEFVDMSEWVPTSDEWVKDANSDIDYDEDKGNFDSTEFKYTVADLVGAMSKIEKAENTPERMQAIYNAYLRTTSIDKTNATVTAKIAELQPYLAEYNEYVKRINTSYGKNVVGVVVGGKGDE